MHIQSRGEELVIYKILKCLLHVFLNDINVLVVMFKILVIITDPLRPFLISIVGITIGSRFILINQTNFII